jgi:radical SAM enzyme (TIGR01210 family)
MSYPQNPLVVSKIRDIRDKYLRKITSHEIGKIWSSVAEKDRYITVTVVIPTRGCSWALSENSGCSVCGYVNDSSREQQIPTEKILNRITSLILDNRYDKPVELQIFNSGSFFDDRDVPSQLRNTIIELILQSSQVFKLSVECRPEYIIKGKTSIEKTVKQLSEVMLEIGIGLESSNDTILRDCWNKGTTVSDYAKSVKLLQSMDVRVKTYVFIKPPFLNEREAMEDTIKTIIDAIQIGTDVISINPCNVQNGTLVHELFNLNKYHPPWLWTVLHIIQCLNIIDPTIKAICDPTAAGKIRGGHNCGKCDKIVMQLIRKALLRQEIPNDLSQICNCYFNWKSLITNPWEKFRIRNQSKLRKLSPLNE